MPYRNFDALPLGIFVIDDNYRIRHWNRHLHHFTGWSPREMEGTDARDRIPGLLRSDYWIRLQDVFQRGTPAVFSPQLHAPLLRGIRSNQTRVHSTTITALPNPNSTGFLAVVSIQDITDLTHRLNQLRATASQLEQELTRRNELESELNRAKEAAEHASRAKTDFLAVMSHEIRTPMHAILGIAEVLSESKLTEMQRGQVELFRRAGQHLMSLLNDILDLSKIESGRVALEEIPFNLESLLVECVNLTGPRAAAKSLSLIMRVSPGLPVSLIGDPNRIQQILMNLLGNAIKFTDRGRVELYVGPSGEHSSGQIEFAVADSGLGIPKDKLDVIFQDFSQVDSSITRKYGGTGLGLSIARRLVEAMGGELNVHSEPGRGTTFSFTLKLKPDPAAALARSTILDEGRPWVETPADSAPPPQDKLRILVAEDSEDNQLLIQAYLSGTPHELRFTNNGREALEAFGEEAFDLVLMDVQMPVMDGLTAAREIRRAERAQQRARTPVVAITASALAHDREASQQAGCDEHLTKPLSKARLLHCLAQFGGKTGEPVPRGTAASGPNPAPQPIVVTPPAGLEELIAPYLESRRKELARLKELLAGNDLEQIRKLGHQLKGTGGGYGFPLLTRLGSELEEAAKAARPGDVQACLHKLEDFLARVQIRKDSTELCGIDR